MIGLHTKMLEPFLNGDPDRATATPEADQKIRPESCLMNIGRQLKRIEEQIICRDGSLVHFSLGVAKGDSIHRITRNDKPVQSGQQDRTMKKTVLTAQELLEDSFRLGLEILESGYKPTLIIAIWRGGTPVGMALQEILAYCGVTSDHIAIRTSSYEGVDKRGAVSVHGLNYIIKKICYDDRILIVDDVFDTGNTIVAVIEELSRRARGNTPEDIRVAVPWFKPTRNETDRVPDYYLHETAEWLVFPHELDALSVEEMRQYRPQLSEIVYGPEAVTG